MWLNIENNIKFTYPNVLKIHQNSIVYSPYNQFPKVIFYNNITCFFRGCPSLNKVAAISEAQDMSMGLYLIPPHHSCNDQRHSTMILSFRSCDFSRN